MIFKPMLAKDAPGDLATLKYPLIVQPKIDGSRVCIVDGAARTRSLKPVPNKEIREYLSRPEFEGLDGEIVVGSPTDPNAMQNTTTFFMSKSKTGADWKFYVFDYVPNDYNDMPADEACVDRLDCLEDAIEPFVGDEPRIVLGHDPEERLVRVEHQTAYGPLDIDMYEAEYLEQGYEGIMLRDPDATYKFGRSGKKGPLLKLKQFQDAEAKITGFVEKMHNGNEAKTNELGRTQRSTSKEGMVPTGMLGAFICEAINGPHEGQRFQIGTGFSAAQRQEFWDTRDEIKGRVVTFTSFPVGVKDAPRFPVFKSFRAESDLPRPEDGSSRPS